MSWIAFAYYSKVKFLCYQKEKNVQGYKKLIPLKMISLGQIVLLFLKEIKMLSKEVKTTDLFCLFAYLLQQILNSD